MELVLATLVIVLNISASIYCLTREYSEINQKIAQTIIVWIVPFLGAIGLTVFHWLERNPTENPKPLGGGSNESIDTWNAHRSVNNGGLDN